MLRHFAYVASALLIAALVGCASTKLPSCDGNHRRPVNEPPQADVSTFSYLSCGAAA